VIRDGRYVVPDVVWTAPDGDRYPAHVVRRGRDESGGFAVVEFEDEVGIRSVLARSPDLEPL
jgi:hypothetical protein